MIIIALGVDTLFVKEDVKIEGDVRITANVKYGWKSPSGSIVRETAVGSVTYEVTAYDATDSKMKTAGQVWLAFGILSVFAGVTGSAIALAPPLKQVNKIVPMVVMAAAGLFMIIGAAGAFSGGDKNVYSKKFVDAKVGASIIMAFLFGIAHFLGVGAVLVDKE